MTFGEKLYELRKSSGLSQEQLAEKCSITRQSVSKWELGQGYPETEKLLVLCRVLEVDIDYLLRDEIENKNLPHKEAVINPYEKFLGQWATMFLHGKDMTLIKLAAITAMNDEYIVFEKESKMGIIKISEIKSISEPMINEKKANALPPISTFELRDCDNPYKLVIGRPCIIMLKQRDFSLIRNSQSFTSATITEITDGNLTVSFRGKELIIKADDIFVVIEN